MVLLNTLLYVYKQNRQINQKPKVVYKPSKINPSNIVNKMINGLVLILTLLYYLYIHTYIFNYKNYTHTH